MENKVKTEQQEQYTKSLFRKQKLNKQNPNTVRLRGFQCSIPDRLMEVLKLKNGQKVIVYKDDNHNFFITKGDNQGFIIKDGRYINPNRLLKTGIKTGDYQTDYSIINRGDLVLHTFILSGKPILEDTIKQIGWDYRGGSNSATVLYPDKKIISVPTSSPSCFFSPNASDYLGLSDGKRGLIIQGNDKERYLMILDKYSSNVTQGLVINKYKDRKRFMMSSTKIQKKTIPPAVYEIEKAGEIGGTSYYKLIKIGKPLHSLR